MVKEPKKAKKALEYLDNLVTWLQFYIPQLPKDQKKEILYIAETLSDLTIDEKVKNFRLATKLKAKWREQEKELVEKAEKYDQITQAITKGTNRGSTN